MYEMPYKTYFSTKRILHEKNLTEETMVVEYNLTEAWAFDP